MRPTTAQLDAAVRRYRKLRRAKLHGLIDVLWRKLGGQWECSDGWAERQVRRHLRSVKAWEDAVRDGLIAVG